MAPTRLKDRLDDLRRGCIGRAAWPPRTIFQRGCTVSKIALDPLVAGLARDPIALAQLADAEHFSQIICDKLKFLVHRRHLTPRHGHLPRCPTVSSNCYLCPQT